MELTQSENQVLFILYAPVTSVLLYSTKLPRDKTFAVRSHVSICGKTFVFALKQRPQVPKHF